MRNHQDRKSTRLNSSHTVISYAVFCLKKKKRPAGAAQPTGSCARSNMPRSRSSAGIVVSALEWCTVAMPISCAGVSFFFFNDTATTEIYTLSLHDALPILPPNFTVVAPVNRVPVMVTTVPDRKSTRLNSSHTVISYAVFCLKKKKIKRNSINRLKKKKKNKDRNL